ncbi:hypothetical protein IHE56_01170 [Streptomyces sp. ID01-12c]|uniref:Uncharacterized protein n=1 Tax=Streptomyces caniscabiei TaxID=2746961 RepID=A0A927L4Y8_9ACTN|nr:hypothetical protein [Streptomyces caniscabiei]MBD9700723.1 hypothetical protein [Streptomyces caniscabiei]MBD9725118.1 hypothetical protein [Streptomyces caniscabiei]MDX3510305.1 hypothetical protein [Streptomyces caniscabiei]MDX3720389.1 hypothetical protein [Streptomyces caniscabiei]MDX3727734.1 hypothetical protein [Streptomyces caniscabiei]
MTRDEALYRMRQLARARALGRHVGSDRLIQAGLDALLADVDSPSLALLAGLGRREEHEARELFDHVVGELGLGVEAPADPIAARWALAYWYAAQIVDGSLDPATGADLIWVEAASDLGYPEALQPIVECAVHLDDWNADWSTPLEQLKEEVLVAARALVARGEPETNP